MRKRLVFSSLVAAASVAAIGSVAFAAGGFGAPGTTTFHDLSASAGLTDSTGGVVFISVDRGIQTFKPRGVEGPPTMVGPETVLSYYGNSATGTFFSGCFVIPDSSFAVDSKLSTATLKVDPTVETPCPGFLVPAGSGGRPGQSGVVPNAGSGGGGGQVTFSANLVWTSNGAVTSFHFTNDARCQRADAHTAGSSKNTFGSVSGTLSLLTSVSSNYASINEADSREVITATFSNACTGA
jgi:hypothetical protein